MNNGGYVLDKQLDKLMNSFVLGEPRPVKMTYDEVVFPMNYFADWRININKFNPEHIEKVIFNPPATIVIFKDGSKEVVKCSNGDTYDPELGFAQAMMNVMFGSRSTYSKFIKKQINNSAKNKEGVDE